MAKVHLIHTTIKLLNNYSVRSCIGYWGYKKSKTVPALKELTVWWGNRPVSRQVSLE